MLISQHHNGFFEKIILIISILRPVICLLCYSSYFTEKYEECEETNYCFLLEDYSAFNATEIGNQSRSCERRGFCKMLMENLKGKILTKYGLTHKCGTFQANRSTFTDLCCCNFDWCNKLKVKEPPILQGSKDRKMKKRNNEVRTKNRVNVPHSEL